MKTLLLVGLALASAVVPRTAATVVLRFERPAPGAILPAGWKTYRMSRHKPAATVSLVDSDSGEVLHIDADRSAGAVAHHLDLPAATTLEWRWKVDHSVARANYAHRSGDDEAARVYVFFDVPRKSLSWYQRLKLDLAEHALGHPLPTAALCYIWDNRHPVGSIARSPFFAGVRTIVLESGNARAGTWQSERRDLAADYRASFGKSPPRIGGIALAADTDNTRSRDQAWFGDISLTPDPKQANR